MKNIKYMMTKYISKKEANLVTDVLRSSYHIPIHFNWRLLDGYQVDRTGVELVVTAFFLNIALRLCQHHH